MTVFRFGSYLSTLTSNSLIGQLYTFKLVDQLRSLLILPKLALLVKKIKIVELLVPLDFVKLFCLHFLQNLILLFQALFDFRIAFRVKILCAN